MRTAAALNSCVTTRMGALPSSRRVMRCSASISSSFAASMSMMTASQSASWISPRSSTTLFSTVESWIRSDDANAALLSCTNVLSVETRTIRLVLVGVAMFVSARLVGQLLLDCLRLLGVG